MTVHGYEQHETETTVVETFEFGPDGKIAKVTTTTTTRTKPCALNNGYYTIYNTQPAPPHFQPYITS